MILPYKFQGADVIFLAARFSYGFVWIILFLSACTSPKKIIYFQDISENIPDTMKVSAFSDHIIQPGDILQVNISSANPAADALFNNINQALNNGSNEPGIIVDRSGFINMPYTGRISMNGLNTTQAKDSMQKLLAPQLKDPTVNVRIANFKVSVLGDVAKPGTYTVPNERVNILQAISLAGDLNITGKRNNIVIIREEKGSKIFTRVDLRSKNSVESEYFNLRSNDVVYVEPSKGKITQNDTRTFQIATFAATLLSLVTIIITRANF